MAESGPTSAIIPFKRIKSSQAIKLDLSWDTGIAYDVVPRYVNLLRTLRLVAKIHHGGPLDIIVVLQIKFELHLSDLVLKTVDPILDL